MNWETSNNNASVRDSAVDGSIKTVIIKNRGVGLGTANRTYTRVPIHGDGSDAECTVVVNNDQQVESVTISNPGKNYSFGNVNLVAGNVPIGNPQPVLDVIMSPPGGHGKDIYRELGAKNALMYARIENDDENPDFVTGNQISRIGIVKNPRAYNSTSNLSLSKASAVYALRLTGVGYSSATFTADSFITQTIGTGVTAVGRVVNYEQTTGVLKYWQDRTLAGFNTVGTAQTNPQYGYTLNRFSDSISGNGSIEIVGTTSGLNIATTFSGVSTTLNNRTYYLGQSFTNGVSNPEVAKYTGDIIYIDNRPSITRSSSQKEDIKIILQF